jgi:uncharacterized membrane protein YkvA (DUF1232 family)
MSKTRTFAYVGAVARALRLAMRPGGPTLGERLASLPRLLRALRTGDYTQTSLFRLALIAAGVAYVVSPIDLLPEAVLGVFGLADDAMVLAWVTTAIVEETEKYLAWEQSAGAPAGAWAFAPSDNGASGSTVRSDVVR